MARAKARSVSPADTGSFNPGIPSLKERGKYTEAHPDREMARHSSARHLTPSAGSGTKGSTRARHSGNPGAAKRAKAG